MTQPQLDQLVGRIRKWGPHEVETALRRLRAGEPESPSIFRRRPLAFVSAAAGLGLAAAALVVVLAPPRRSAGPPVAGSHAGAPSMTTLALGEGTDATFGRDSDVAVIERSAQRVAVLLRAGAARFHVRHDPGRRFRVTAGVVQIDDIGTVFDVRHVGERVQVAVQEGSVAVTFPARPGGDLAGVTLGAGESGIYPPAPAAAAPAPEEEPTVGPRGGGPVASWRARARDGRYQQAFQLLSRTRFRDVRDEPTDLLLAADVARLSGHAAASVAPLRQVVDRHAADARAPAAAFTLGWVLMNNLRRPRQAAEAFTTAERLAPSGNLAEDASARAAEAWYGARDLPRAAAQLRRYAETYPHGRHQAVLERLIGIP